MVIFVSGVLVGIVVAAAIGVGAAKAGFLTHLPSLLGIARFRSQEFLGDAAMQDVKANDPDLAALVESPPAVPVETIPEEISPSIQQAISSAPDQNDAVAQAKRFFRDPDLARAVTALIRWRTRRNNTESQYEGSFRSFARRVGYRGDMLEKEKRILWRGKKVAVPDLVLDERVLVELKADLTSSSDADRAMGQMLRYLLAWKNTGPAVLAICGEVSPEIRFLVRVYINTWRRQLNLPVTVIFKRGEVLAEDGVDMPTEAPLLESAE